MNSHYEDEDRRRAVVAEARRRLQIPGWSIVALGMLQLVGTAFVYLAGRFEGSLPVALAGMVLLVPVPLLLLGGTLLRRVGGWNLAFAGLLFSAGLWALASVAMLYVGFSSFAGVVVPLTGIGIAFAAVIALAQLGEQAHVRAARSILRPMDPDAEPIRGPL